MGWSITYTLKFIQRFHAVLPPPRRPRIGARGTKYVPMRWPASIIEDLRRLHRLPFDEIDPKSDWLARYVKEGTHGPHREEHSDHR